MKKIISIFMLVFILAFGLSMPVQGVTTDYTDLPDKINVDTTKEWTVNFNMSLDASTVNADNIKIYNKSGTSIPVSVCLGQKDNTIVIGPNVSGYVPGNTYSLILSDKVKAKSGVNLKKPVRMKFTTSLNYSNGSSFKDLPQIQSAEFDSRPLISGKAENLNLTCDVSSKVQYRVYTYKYVSGLYEEVTNGYTSPVDGNIPYQVSFLKSLSDSEKSMGIKYKVIIYVKNANAVGSHKDSNTDYDNYYVDYVKCVNSTDATGVTNYNMNDTLEKAVAAQLSGGKTDEGSSDAEWVYANSNQVKYYLDPSNFSDSYGKYQFLELNYVDGITEDVLNTALKGKGILDGKGNPFVQAGETYNISPVYLVSHALLETGNGQSILAQGVTVSSVNGQAVEPKTVYNFFGIHAYDSDAVKGGSEYAYTQGWFTPEAAIIGGAEFVSEDYINNSSTKQNTLYKMRWNFSSGNIPAHQYATDIGWAYKQIYNIKSIMDKYTNLNLKFDVPMFIK